MAALFAVLAIMLKVVIPAGFMAAAPGEAGSPIVICTGQGTLQVTPEQLPGGHKAPGKGAAHDMPCAFSGHGAAAAAQETPAVPPVEFVAFQDAAPAPVRGLAPGRGLAAPPLPARGPPSLMA